MTRFIASVLCLLLAANICGASITHHLCGKKSQYISFSGKRKHTKCCCGGGMDKGCCKTKHIKVKLDEKQTVAKSLFWNKPFLFEATLPALPMEYRIAVRPALYAPIQQRANPPPLLAFSVPLYVLHRVFLI